MMSQIITNKDVETVIDRAVGSKVKILNYKLEDFTKMKSGCLGSHYILTVNIEETSNTDNVCERTCTFFVKMPPESSVIQEVFMDEGIFEEEVNFYEEIQPLMLADYNGERWSAKCYLTKPNALVHEDLRAQGFSIRSELLMDATFLQSALATLARFHASSLLAEAKLGKSLKQAYPKHLAEKMYTTHNKFGRGTKVGYETIVLMADKFGLDSSLVLPDLLNYVHRKVKPREEQVNVVCHSDLYKNNIMFNEHRECIIVDYQILRYASPAVDFGMLLHLNTTPEFRKKSEIDMFKHYYSVFQRTLQQSRRKVQIPSYDYMLKDYLSHRVVGMTYAALYLPAIYLKPGYLDELQNDPEMNKRFFLCNRIEHIGPEIDSNPVYAKQMKSILIELLDETRRVLSFSAK